MFLKATVFKCMKDNTFKVIHASYIFKNTEKCKIRTSYGFYSIHVKD